MLEREVSLITRLGIGVIILSLAIGIGFSIFSLTNISVANATEYINQEENGATDPTRFKEYDNTLVTGNSVRDAIYKYANSSMTVYVATYQTQVNSKHFYPGTSDKLSGIKEVYTDNGLSVPTAPAYIIDNAIGNINPNVTPRYRISYKQVKGSNRSYTYEDLNFIAYGTIYGSQTSGDTGTVTDYSIVKAGKYYRPALYFNKAESRFLCQCGVVSNGNVEYRNDLYANTSNSDRTEFISPFGKFQAYLVVSDYDDVLGIAFIQIAD